jgi:hypothetical protein
MCMLCHGFEEALSAPQVPLDDEGAFLMVEDEADRVMPSAKAVQSAGRYDLHHAILFQGGYAAVRCARLFWLRPCAHFGLP